MMGPMPRPSPDDSGELPDAARSTRRIAAGAAFGAVVALAVATVLGLGGNAGGAQAGQRALDAPVSSCLDWTADNGSDVRLVDCAQPHLFQSVGADDLGKTFGPAAAFPSEQAWLPMVKEGCTPLAMTFLDGRYDPEGRFTVGALKPSQQGWRSGDRALHCGLQVVSRAGELYRVQGDVRKQEQADVHASGTCLGIDGIDVGDPVDCAQPHAVEVVGVVDLSVPFPQPDYPDEAKQDEAAGAACNKLAQEYAGAPGVVAAKKLFVYWDTLRLDSWRAGTRRVDCKLGALLPDKSGFAPVSGGVRGEVTIGDQPAPPAPKTATPGAPAKIQPPLPPPATTADGGTAAPGVGPSGTDAHTGTDAGGGSSPAPTGASGG
jgi:hypothetical protein